MPLSRANKRAQRKDFTVNQQQLPTSYGSASTDRENTEKGFVAPERLRSSLQSVLVNLIDLQLVAKQAHWNIVGANFRDLHRNLDELVGVTREAADTLAERLRALHATADGRAAVVATQSKLPEFPAGEITTHDAIGAVVLAIDVTTRHVRDVHDGVDEDDPTSADLLHGLLADLEQQSWMIGAEIRRPAGVPEPRSDDATPSSAQDDAESAPSPGIAKHTGLPPAAQSDVLAESEPPSL
ncbi:DNA starvation/stationary phase protection protein [Galactobacter valiniphilus]|uniref:DNA starvation/stationary phase protection protein n=1 Tax=Galactobacter valiniphilus TaxID=2676122 RepID=A0A399JBW3_9MICC|nr:DNA starvation/stationary phase protection protein [Galactobacter valiniphilus]